jgi:hypothetical protein
MRENIFMKFPSKNQISNWILDGSWSIGIATLLSRGVISPLTLGISAVLFAVQAKGNFPIARTARGIVNGVVQFYDDYIDGNYKPPVDPEPTDKKAYYSEYGMAKRYEEVIDDGLEEEFRENTVDSFKAPGMFTWLFGEKKATYQVAPMDPTQISNIPHGTTRSGNSFKRY